ncbi:MAG: hypothetical protein MK180_13905 [Rhodobacteraceae bacterium]|nr:hypothetical protein [Paracoccaceae bacterium]
MRAVAVIAFLAAAVPAAAQELNSRQQAAYDAILPALEATLEEQGGAAVAALVPMLAGCVVVEARRGELNTLGDGDIGENETKLLNELMARPVVQGCVAKAANGG